MSSIIEKPIINGLSHIKNPSAVLPTLIIEACCTSGRTYQSYKRGGKLEAQERFREEVTCAAFWLWGVKGLNKIGDFIGEKIFKKELTDTGKDALRDPAYLMSNGAKIFKFGKIISSVIIATGLIGFVVPKINHAITTKALKRNKAKEKKLSLQEFINNSKDKKEINYINFKGSENFINALMRASYNLENKNAWRLISTDAGMIAGRMHNSRHPAERFEYLFRDTSSIIFYNATTGLVIAALNKLFKKTDIHPKALDIICEFLNEKHVTKEQLLTTVKPEINKQLENINFEKNGTIKLTELIKELESMNFGIDILEKARKMSELQPLLRGEAILSKAQVKDVLSNSITSDPVFLKRVIDAATYGRASDKKKFVSAQTCQSIRESIDSFIQEIIKAADGKEITKDFIKKVKRNTLIRTAAFQFAGLAFSAFGLAILIPRMQIMLSQKLYGKNTFEDIATGNKKDGKSRLK